MWRTPTGWWWLEHDWIMTFHILGIIIPTDFHIFQMGCFTTNQPSFSAFVIRFLHRNKTWQGHQAEELVPISHLTVSGHCAWWAERWRICGATGGREQRSWQPATLRGLLFLKAYESPLSLWRKRLHFTGNQQIIKKNKIKAKNKQTKKTNQKKNKPKKQTKNKTKTIKIQ